MIEKSTLNFLSELKQNNNRTWFNDHKDDYKAALANFTDLVAILLHNIAGFDKRLVGVLPKECLFRIYRDVRFSKDKSPYKTWFSASMNGGGKNTLFPGYYIHLEPGNTYLGGGIWHPPKDILDNIREYIIAHHPELEKIVLGKTFKKHFGEMGGEQLKTAPKGYPKDHPQIRWLRYKDFLAGCSKNKLDITSDKIIPDFSSDYKAMFSFMQFLRQAIL
ncbi:MAG: TIGR02453 family protein [Candidatus Marinimicrobia bacterium]|jgi:uncharacterized protein (TIGR02453 family)|nr:TIGR02453 family protein [Candidatus Neomarinimicrobiota bacterium]MDP7216685.1 DUF2461 domain-containing protein [Candidatus Neomarinimicrobiota bacterium]HBN45670.1 hypothetical protein [Candidatus Neomarinimicrobiota bacterium]HJL74519.1 DUF2461 domain-containing protein [Candidatus Neomarinimicrobiota bacterium]|tara:strand:+ start:1931 stop:2587 length:657 start_codon:yes stop_codon:yes gene_type:complete